MIQNTIKVGKTSFEKRLTNRLDLLPLYDTDLNITHMKKDFVKKVKNETIYNHIIDNYSIFNSYYLCLSVYYPLYFVAYQPNLTTTKVKCIDFTFGANNNNNNNINFLTFFYNANLTDEELNLENFLCCTYGLSLDSADGEVKLKFFTKKYFYYIFNYNNPNLINFLDNIYNIFLKYDFFKKNNILITENKLVVSNIFYYKFLAFILFINYFKYNAKTLYNNANTLFTTFLKHNNTILKKILSEFDIEIILAIEIHYDKMLTTVKPKKDNILKKEYDFKMVFFYEKFRVITKYIPKDLNNNFLDELNDNYKINLLLFNNITGFLPLTINSTNIINKFIYNNPNIIHKFKENKNYLNVIHMLNNIDKYAILNTKKKDIKTNTESTDNLKKDISSIVNKLNKNILTDESIAIFMEDVGRPFYDFPFYIYNLNKQIQNNTLHPHHLTLINSSFFYFNAKYYIFNIIYTLYVLNNKLGIIHSDLHLNNLTINVNRTERFIGQKAYFELLKTYTSEEIFAKTFILCRNLFIMKNKNLKNNAFLIPTNFYNICIIDFSRAVNKKNKYNCSQKLYDMVLDVYPEYINNKVFKDKLYTISLLKTNELFDIMSGYDIYNLLLYLYSFFTDEKFLKIKYFPKQPVKEINFISNMFNYIKNSMLKNIKKLMNNTFKGYIINTNELLLYKYYNNFLLKNYEKNDFFKPKNIKTDKPSYFQFLDADEWIDLFQNKKINVANIYNAQNEFKITNLEQYIERYINIPNTDNEKIFKRKISQDIL